MASQNLADMILEGSISETYTVDISIRKSDGQTCHYFQGCITPHDFIQDVQQLDEQISNGMKAKNQTLDECYEEFCLHQMPHYSASTCRSYKSHYKKEIRPKLGSRQISTISTQDIKIFLDDLNCRESRKKTIHTLLNDLFERADGLKLIEFNPMKDVVLTFPIYKDHMPFCQEDLQTLKKKVNSPSSPLGECICIFLELSYQCRLTRNLILNLTWKDIDFDHACIRIPVPSSRKKGIEHLSIPLSSSLLQTLQNWKKKNRHLYICACKEYGRLDSIELNRALKPQLDDMKIHFVHGLDSETFMSDELCCIKGYASSSKKRKKSRKAGIKGQKKEKSSKKAC